MLKCQVRQTEKIKVLGFTLSYHNYLVKVQLACLPFVNHEEK